MEKKLGVYICSGCSIGQAVDVDSLAEEAKGLPGVSTVRTSGAFCLEDVELIKKDLLSQEVDTVVVAACSPRVNRAVFRFPDTGIRRVNLREQVAWSHPAGEEATQEMASDNLRMGVAAAALIEKPTPFTEAHEKRIAVVGGGLAGMAAAIAAAEVGYQVVLIESQAELGGYARKIHRDFPRPTGDDFRSLGELDVAETAARVTASPSIELLLGNTVTEVAGQPGRFELTLSGGDSRTVGSIVMATGFRPVGAESFVRYGLGENPDVITSLEFEEMARTGQLTRPSTGQPAKRVAILACDGPEDGENLPYTGNAASMIGIKQALYVREMDPEAEAFLIYEDMQTPGRNELVYRRTQEEPGVFFVRGNVAEVTSSDSGMTVSVESSVLHRPIAIDADLIVLQVGMAPVTVDEEGAGALGLHYLQGNKVPTWRAGYADSNFLCFPYETRRTGIYTAGSVHRSQDGREAARDGEAAALKAVQVIEKATEGMAVHPRVGEQGFPRFFLQRCTACGRCTQECPFGALELDADHHPSINPNRCRRCGICMGACPVQIISFPDYSVPMISAMAKASSMPEDDEDKMRILVLACENDAYPALDMVGINRGDLPAIIRVVPVRCLGSVNALVVSDAMQDGWDGVALMGCKKGEDYQCHFIQGSELLGRRMANIQETLGRLAIEPERVQVMETAISDSKALPGVLKKVVEEIQGMGLNPMKGF